MNEPNVDTTDLGYCEYKLAAKQKKVELLRTSMRRMGLVVAQVELLSKLEVNEENDRIEITAEMFRQLAKYEDACRAEK